MKGKKTLYAPPAYINAPRCVRAAVANGCGTGGWKAYLVPDTLWGLDVTEACNIHDWMYQAGSTIEDKQEADRVLLNNLLRLIEAADSLWIVARLRRNRAWLYYQAVDKFGGPAFWEGKNRPENIMRLETA